MSDNNFSSTHKRCVRNIYEFLSGEQIFYDDFHSYFIAWFWIFQFDARAHPYTHRQSVHKRSCYRRCADNETRWAMRSIQAGINRISCINRKNLYFFRRYTRCKRSINEMKKQHRKWIDINVLWSHFMRVLIANRSACSQKMFSAQIQMACSWVQYVHELHTATFF